MYSREAIMHKARNNRDLFMNQTCFNTQKVVEVAYTEKWSGKVLPSLHLTCTNL